MEPDPGQESVWDYPRPPVAKSSTHRIEVRHGDTQIAATTKGYRLLETASPPTFYLPPDSVDWSYLAPVSGSSVCEWKGAAQYWALLTAPDKPVA
ncbi:MAG: DUF427 domain-containing protein, partial [Gammaproteobacteria bacterium]|nr:DUF427 domain-containing protein [Gammaproteobacteria bacterium]